MIGLNCLQFQNIPVRVAGNTVDEVFFAIVRARQLNTVATF